MTEILDFVSAHNACITIKYKSLGIVQLWITHPNLVDPLEELIDCNDELEKITIPKRMVAEMLVSIYGSGSKEYNSFIGIGIK